MTTEVVEFILQAHAGNGEWREVRTADDFDTLMRVVKHWQPKTHGISVEGIDGWAWVKQNDLRIIMVVTTTHEFYMPANLGSAGVE